MTEDALISEAPFTDTQLLALRLWQHSEIVHPYTCGRCRDVLGVRFRPEQSGPESGGNVRIRRDDDYAGEDVVIIDRELVPARCGLVCPFCGRVQTWAHEFSTSIRHMTALDEQAKEWVRSRSGGPGPDEPSVE